MRQKREKTNTKKKNKKLTKTAITPTTEPEDKDVPRMEVRDLDHMDMLVVCIHAPTDA